MPLSVGYKTCKETVICVLRSNAPKIEAVGETVGIGLAIAIEIGISTDASMRLPVQTFVVTPAHLGWFSSIWK